MHQLFQPKRVAAFAILFALYQSAEGVGDLLLHSFAVQAALMTAMVLAAWPVGRWLLGARGYDAYALEPRRGALAWLIGGGTLAIAAKAAALAVGLRLGAYTVADSGFGLPAGSGLALVIAGAAAVTFIPSIAEDILTRGFWWRQSNPAWRGVGFVFGSSLIYVLNHVYRLADGPGVWVMLFCFGTAYAAALARSGSLWAAVGLHWGWNFANTVLDAAPGLSGDARLTPWISATVHLVLTAIIVLIPVARSSRPQPG